MVKKLTIPMCPTANRITMPFRGRLIKSPEYRIYEQKMQVFKLKNFRILDEIEKAFTGKLLRVDAIFVFNHKRIFTKKGELKKLDYSNRIKISEDILAKLINIDDSKFVEGYHSKAYSEDNVEEYIVFTIYEIDEVKGFKL